MLKIASEMNLSETAFIRQLPDCGGFNTGFCFGLRWFTPTIEVPLCGHATMASAAVLFYGLGTLSGTSLPVPPSYVAKPFMTASG